jgi:hypothetical protein
MGNFIERNQTRKENFVFERFRAEECPHEFVEVSTQTQACGPLFYSVESAVKGVVGHRVALLFY